MVDEVLTGFEQFGNIPPGAPDPTAWPLQNPLLYSFVFAVVIIVVFAPLSVRRFKCASR